MREQQDFEPALRRAASAWEEQAASAELDARLRAVVAGGRAVRERRWAPWVGWTAAAGLVAAAAALVVSTRGPSLAPAPPGAWSAQFMPASCAPVVLTPVLTLAAGCRVLVPGQGLAVEAVEAISMRRTADALALERGRARVAVEVAEARTSPLVLVLAGARIEVEAGVMEARAEAGGGRVRVESGRARWVPSIGAPVELSEGQARGWAAASGAVRATSSAEVAGLPAARGAAGAEGAVAVGEPAADARPAQPVVGAARGGAAEAAGSTAGGGSAPASSPVPAGAGEPVARPSPRAGPATPVPPTDAAPRAGPVAPAPLDRGPLARTAAIPPSQWSAEQTASAIRWVEQLRAEGRYAEAVTWIARLLEAPLDARAAEVLSFERGQLLESKLRQLDAACTHWQSHRARFGGGRYAPELEAALGRCGGVR